MSNTHNATGLYNPDGSVTFYGNTDGGGSSSSSAITATYEESPAIYAHAIDDILYYNNKFYDVTSAIAIGDTLTVSSGLIEGNISERAGGMSYEVFGIPGGGSGGTVIADDVSYDNTSSGLTATNVQDAIDEVNSSIGSIVTDLRTRSKRLYEGFLNTNQSANVTIPSRGNYLVVAGDLNGTDYKMNAWLVSVIGTPSNGRHTIFKFVNEAQKATISFSSNTTLVLSTTDANGTEFTVTQL